MNILESNQLEEATVYRQSISDSWLGNFKRMSGSSGLKVQAAIAC